MRQKNELCPTPRGILYWQANVVGKLLGRAVISELELDSGNASLHASIVAQIETSGGRNLALRRKNSRM
jgi:hypothetical protein